MSTRSLTVLALVLGVAFAAAPASATLSRAMDLPELVAESDTIALVRAVAQAPRRDARGRIVTDITLEVLDSLKGAARPGESLTLVRLGGSLGEVGMHIEGEPSFVEGSRYVVFLRPWDGAFRPVGMSQGVMPVAEGERGVEVQPGGGGLSLVDGPRGRPAPGALLGPMPLEHLLAEIRGLVRR
ncbi:MAG: hypothetical protein KF901_22745 [Myxococcales bacterium]|nr:hypothetical protein [Myxococcales bacterium]